MSFVFINLISCLITLRNKPQLQSSGDHVNALILNQLFNLVSLRGILRTAGINKLTGRVRFLSVQTFYGALKKRYFLCCLFVLAMCLRSSCPHHVAEQNCQNRLSSSLFIPSLFPLLSLGLPCVTTTSKPLKLGYLFI